MLIIPMFEGIRGEWLTFCGKYGIERWDEC